MIVIGSAAKRHRQSEKRRIHNKAIRSEVRTHAKGVEDAVGQGNQKEAQEAFKRFSSLMDSAARKGVFHKNTAARKKSRLAKKVNALKA